MTSSCDPAPLPLAATPASLIAAWPRQRPLIALLSAHDPLHPSPWARWSIFTQPVGTLRLTSASANPRPIPGNTPEYHVRYLGPPDAAIEHALAGATTADDPIAPLQSILRATPSPAASRSDDPDTPPFAGGWIGWLGYDLGHHIEPASRSPAAGSNSNDDRAWPLLEWHRCPAAYIHDAWTNRWWIAGDPDARAALPQPPFVPDADPSPFHLGPMTSATGRDGYESAVRRTIDHIEAGDIFHANIAHRLTGSFRGSARAAFLALAARANPWYGAYLERPAAAEAGDQRRIIASISPELFLDRRGASGRVVTRPIKGTRPARPDRPDLELDLRASAKDIAELVMIVDLMRNDLGRVCRAGSVVVEELRAIERHGAHASTGVLHGVATVAGVLREDADLADLLRAAFPPGSVTGAPKIRAMQIIDELEPVPRGPYCGAIGYVSDSGRAAFNVAIRTACITADPLPPESPRDEIADGLLDYHAGAGIVAESDPTTEWRETLDKAATVLSLASPADADTAGVAATTPS